MRLVIEELTLPPMALRPMEIVERKGLGHPDSICDAVMESISVALCGYYLRHTGSILHHNIDKGLLVAGNVEKWFGGGRVRRPMALIIGDRATLTFGGVVLPVADIAVETARRWFRENLRYVDAERDLRCQVRLAEGSAELKDIFARPSAVFVANDTSAAVGYFPLSPVEALVLSLERYLNGPMFKERFPETGEDVKIMAVREGDALDVTVAMPLLARQVVSEADYFARKDGVEKDIREFVAGKASGMRPRVWLNALDRRDHGAQGAYLSLLGTSAEDADSGQVGRGNRVNGLISVGRPLGTEAVAGKNPVSHVGKIYNVLAHRMAREVCVRVEGIREACVFLVSRIGEPVNRPERIALQVILEPGCTVGEISARARDILEAELEAVPGLCVQLAEGRFPVC